MNFRASLLLGVCAVSLWNQPVLATNGYFSHGYGIQSKGQAGAGIALSQDTLSIATNPAALVAVGDRLDIGLDVFFPHREASITGNAFGPDKTYDGNNSKYFPIPEAGYSKLVNPRLALGVAIYGNGGMNTDYATNPYERFGASGPAGVDLAQLFFSPAAALKLGEHNTVGLAVNLAYQRFKAKGLGVFAPFSSDPNHLTDQGYDSSTGYGIRLGWLGNIDPSFSVGATWQSKTRMGKLDKYRGLFSDQGVFDIPENYGVGLAYRPTDAVTVAFDVQRILYSRVASIGNGIAKLFQGVPLGASNGPGFGWRDETVYKLGGSYRVQPNLLLRGGFSIGRQPIPDGETFFNILAPGDVDKHLTLGATWSLGNKSEISVAYAHAFQKTVHGSASIPSAFGGGEANITLKEDSLGVAYGVNF